MDTPLMGGTAIGLDTSDKWASPTGWLVNNVTDQSRSIARFSPAGTLNNFRVVLGTAPGVGESRTFEWFKGATATGITITISGTDTTGEDLTNTYAVTAGSDYYIKMTASGSAATTRASWSTMFTGDVTAESLLMCSSVLDLSLTTTEYLSLGGHMGLGGPATSEADAVCVIPTAGTLKNMSVILNLPPGSGNSRQFQLLLNGSTTALDLTLNDAQFKLTDTSSVTVAAGDRVSVKTIPTSSPVASLVRIGFTFVPDTDGEFCILSSDAIKLVGTGSGKWVSLTSGDRKSGPSATNVPSMAGDAMDIKKLYVFLDAAPGSGNSFAFELYKNGSAEGLTCTVSGAAAVSCNHSSTKSLSAGDLMTTKVVPTSGPTTSFGAISYLGFITPPAAPAADVSAMMMGANF